MSGRKRLPVKLVASYVAQPRRQAVVSAAVVSAVGSKCSGSEYSGSECSG